jgi:two-component system, response regulator PdtaR
MVLTPPGPPPVVGPPFQILIADDDRGNRDTLADLLASRGFKVVTAADGGEAVEIVRVTVVHLVLVDLHMPKLTGLEAVEMVRQMNALLPAILMTADATRAVMREALQKQVFSVIPKPVNMNLVLSTLTQALMQAYRVPAPADSNSTTNPTPPGANPT